MVSIEIMVVVSIVLVHDDSGGQLVSVGTVVVRGGAIPVHLLLQKVGNCEVVEHLLGRNCATEGGRGSKV